MQVPALLQWLRSLHVIISPILQESPVQPLNRIIEESVLQVNYFVARAVGSCVVLESDAIAIIITKVECDAGIHLYYVISAIATGEA